VFEETQKKLQEELQKRAEEARKKLEANPPAGAALAIQRRSKKRSHSIDEQKGVRIGRLFCFTERSTVLPGCCAARRLSA